MSTNEGARVARQWPGPLAGLGREGGDSADWQLPADAQLSGPCGAGAGACRLPLW